MPVADIKIDGFRKEEAAKEVDIQPVTSNEPQVATETEKPSEPQEPARSVEESPLETPMESPSVGNETSSTQQMLQESSSESSELRDSYVKDEPVTSNEPQVARIADRSC